MYVFQSEVTERSVKNRTLVGGGKGDTHENSWIGPVKVFQLTLVARERTHGYVLLFIFIEEGNIGTEPISHAFPLL
jgi:hypothetical protein